MFASIAIATTLVISSGQLFAKTASCPCNPCPCAPCTCGQSKSKQPKPQPNKGTPRTNTTSNTPPSTTSRTNTHTNKTQTPVSQAKGHDLTKQQGQGHGHGHSGGASVGVGVNVDLGGIGQRRAEPDPFGAPAAPQPVTARTEEKPKTPKRTREVAKTDPFTGVQLTGPQAKSESNP